MSCSLVNWSIRSLVIVSALLSFYYLPFLVRETRKKKSLLMSRRLGLFVFRHEFLLRLHRRRRIMTKLHRELAFTLGGGAQVGGKAKHGVQATVGIDGELVSAEVGIADDGVALVEQRDDVALKLHRSGDGGFHERFEHLRSSFYKSLAEGLLGREVKGMFRGIGYVNGAVVDEHPCAENLVADEWPLLACRMEAPFTSIQKLL